MSDVQEAADRIINVFKSRLHYGNLCGSLDADIIKVAELVLAEHPPDDGELITPDRLKSIGFRAYGVQTDFNGGYELGCLEWHETREWWLFEHRLDRQPETMGDLRRLCTALGVPLGVTTQTTNGEHT